MSVAVLDAEDVDLEARVCDEIVQRSLPGTPVTFVGLHCKSQTEVMDSEAVATADVIVMWHTLKANAALIAKMTKARAIVRVGVGYDNIDLDAASLHGIPVCNVPDYGTEEVADHAMCLLLSLYRRVPQITRALALHSSAHGSEGVRDVAKGTRRVRGSVLGIIGLGAIGTAVCIRAKAFGFDVCYFDPYSPAGRDKALGIKRCETFNELLACSNAITFHCTLNPGTRRMLNESAISLLPPGAFVVNTARGGIIDEAALASALQSGHVAGAGIDVHEVEPFSPDDSAAQPLAFAPNCICTPHTAFYSDASFVEIRTKAAQQAARALLGVPLTNVVNASSLGAAGSAIPRAPIASMVPPTEK